MGSNTSYDKIVAFSIYGKLIKRLYVSNRLKVWSSEILTIARKHLKIQIISRNMTGCNALYFIMDDKLIVRLKLILFLFIKLIFDL